MTAGPSSRSAMEIELAKLSSPRIFLVRMVVFLMVCALVMIVLYRQLITAFFANPGLNALIGWVLLIGIILSFRQVIRLYPEVAWVNNFRIADPGLAIDRHPTLLAPMAAILGGERSGRMIISQQTMRHLLDSIATRLDEARDISRYMTGLLVFLGLLGTFWGLIETVGSVGRVIDGLKVGGDAGALFDTLKEGLAAPLGGMGISFSSSLFGLAGIFAHRGGEPVLEVGIEPVLRLARLQVEKAEDQRAGEAEQRGRERNAHAAKRRGQTLLEGVE